MWLTFSASGSSWRSTIKPPHVTFEEADAAANKGGHTGSSIHQLLHHTANSSKLKASCPVVIMPETVEIDGASALKLHVFKQDLLSGEQLLLSLHEIDGASALKLHVFKQDLLSGEQLLLSLYAAPHHVSC